MLNFNTNFYGISIIMYNLYSYILSIFILILILFFCNFTNLSTLNQFKKFNKYKYILYSTIFSLMSFSGIPPLLGFFGKLFIILTLTLKLNYFIVILVLILNIISMYFYIQNTRFIVNKSNITRYSYKNYYFNSNILFLLNINILNFINIFCIFFINDLIRYFIFINSFIFILLKKSFKLKGNLFIKLKARILGINPQKKGVVMKARVVTPRKPNSARRPVAKVVLVNRKRLTAHIPGIGHNIRRHSSVLVRGGGARDLPGVSYTCVRGVYDFAMVLNRLNRRSRYGIPRPDSQKKKLRRKFRT